MIVKADESPHLHALIHDAKRFALYNRSTIEEAPLQIYCSALVFAPEMSIVRGHFKNQIPHWIRGLPKVQRDWSSLEQTLEGHSDWVRSVAFSPDGSKLASGSSDRTVRVWNVATGQVEQTLEGHLDSVWSVVFSPDGSKVASGSRDHTVRVWNVATGQVEQTLEGHSRSVFSVGFSPDGSKVTSGSDDGTVCIWNVATGQAEQTLEDHSNSVSSVVFSPDGSKLASGSDDRTVRIWNVATGQAEQTLEGHSDSVSGVALPLDDSKSHSFYSMDSSMLWVTQNDSRILYLPFDFRPIHFATKDSTLAIGTGTGRVAIVRFSSDVKEKFI
jgi:WD40 repeat protein